MPRRMNTREEVEQLEKVFSSRGASPSQAKVMASQISKRADQWVAERGISRLEALKRLLDIVIAGRDGVVPKDFDGPSSMLDPSRKDI